METDLELKHLGNFIGTTNYTKLSLFKTVVTDGVSYLMKNGYSWFVTDALAVIDFSEDEKLKNEVFLSIKLTLDDKPKMIITDGNDKILYEQNYNYTDAKCNLFLFWANGVLMLSQEY